MSEAQSQEGITAVDTKHTNLPEGAFFTYSSLLFCDLTPRIGLPKHLRWKNDVLKPPSWGDEDHKVPSRMV